VQVEGRGDPLLLPAELSDRIFVGVA
jgi:hypothetical protein